MDCTKYTELMSAVLDGECTAEERRALDAHLAVCPECAALFEILSANAKAARELDCEMPVGLKERILNNLPAQEQPKKQGKVIHWKRWIPVAAAACLVLVVSLVPFTSRGGNAAPEMANADPVSSSYVYDYSKTGATADGSHNYGVVADPAAPGAHAPAEAPESPSAEPDDPAEPAHYWMGNQQVIRVHYGATPAPGAQIVGSVESLANYLSGFDSLMWDGDGNTIPIAELEALTVSYTEEYFRTHRLLCVVIESGSGSNRYEFAPQGLYRDSVTVREHIPEVGTCDMAAWLLVAEVDTMFDDGDIPEVNFTR